MFIFILRNFMLHTAPNSCIVSTLTYRYKKSGWRPKCKINTIMVPIQVIILKLIPEPLCVDRKDSNPTHKKSPGSGRSRTVLWHTYLIVTR